MNEIVTATLHRIFHRPAPRVVHADKPAPLRLAERPRRPDFAETRPVVFRSEAFAEDLVVLSHGAA